MGLLLPNQNRAKAAIAMIWVVAALDAASFASSYFQYQLLYKAGNGNIVLEETARANDTRQQMIAIAYMVAYLVSVVTFIMWFRRAYNNLHQRNAFLSFSEGWAAGSWFVPIFNLFRPYQIMKEMYARTGELLAERQVIHTCRLEVAILGWWWFLWILAGLAGQVEYRISKYATSIDALKEVTVFSMVDNVLGIILAIVAAKVVKNYADAEPLMMELANETTQIEEKVDLL